MKRLPSVRMISLSGGIDSTFELKHALCETDDIVVAHHVHIKNYEGRHEAEAEAVSKIVEYCRKEYRDFDYSESTVDRRGMDYVGFDYITCCAEAGIAAVNYEKRTKRQVHSLVFGTCEEERTTDLAFDMAKGKMGVMTLTAAAWPKVPPQMISPHRLPKKHYIEYMGPELAAMCWYCRRPVRTETGFKECETCRTCNYVQATR